MSRLNGERHHDHRPSLRCDGLKPCWSEYKSINSLGYDSQEMICIAEATDGSMRSS